MMPIVNARQSLDGGNGPLNPFIIILVMIVFLVIFMFIYKGDN